MNMEKIHPDKIYNRFENLGKNAKFYVRKCVGLLPLVNASGVYKKKGFADIYECGRAVAGLSNAQIQLSLNLYERFEAMPQLRNLLVNGDVSMNKLSRVASIATPQNQHELAKNVQTLTYAALDALVRDEKNAREESMQENRKYSSAKLFCAHRNLEKKIKKRIWQPRTRQN